MSKVNESNNRIFVGFLHSHQFQKKKKNDSIADASMSRTIRADRIPSL